MTTELPNEYSVLDFEGKERVFEYQVLDVNVGYSVRAKE
jgi:hypothetical protein